MTVPYIFATATGAIPLSELDANFANVQAYVQTAGTVTASAQPNITSVGTLNSIQVSGNVSTGNLIIEELTTTNDVDVTGQLIVNWLTGNGSPLSGPGILASTANIYDIGESATPFRSAYFNANISAGNLITTGSVKNTGLEIVSPNYINITANAQSANLSSTISTNFIVANNTGYTCTVNLPSVPVDGQITRFTITGNTIVLAAGSGNVNSLYSGSANVGVGFKYIYNASANIWNKSQ